MPPRVLYSVITILLLTSLGSLAAAEKNSRKKNAAEHDAAAGPTVQSLGKLDPFWRYSGVTGPKLEKGDSLVPIPDSLALGDFPYRKRPFAEEVSFADHLSLVRLLGGYGNLVEPPDQKTINRDLAYRDPSGVIRYRMQLLKPRLQPYLDAGYQDLTLMLDNVPYCFPEKIVVGTYGQDGAPRDSKEWHDFIVALCRELVTIMGPDRVQHLRFRVGTEGNTRKRFDGTQDQFFKHYEAAATAVRAIIPQAKVGPYNLSGLKTNRLQAVEGTDNVKTIELAKYCAANKLPFDFFAFSFYPTPGQDPGKIVDELQSVWDACDQQVPSLKGVSREIHEFGIGRMNGTGGFEFEFGAHGVAMRLPLMFRLRQAGLSRLWHWRLPEFTSDAWLFSALEHAVGSDTWLLEPTSTSSAKADYLGVACSAKDRDLLFFSAYNMRSAIHTQETVRFTIPRKLLAHADGTARAMVLDRTNGVFDQIRRDLTAANLLNEEYAKEPELLSNNVNVMGKDGATELVQKNQAKYEKMWQASRTLKPLTPQLGRVTTEGDNVVITLQMAAPMVCVLELKP